MNNKKSKGASVKHVKRSTPDALSKTKQTKLFYVIMLLLPVILLGAVEGVLRLTGFGHSYALFIPAAGLADYLQPNPELIKRYFHQPDLAPNVSPDTLLFKQQKSPESFRIVIQGGSTAAGFPFGRFGSLTGQLQTRLKRLYPDKNIEVISTAMASINSYTLLDTVDEIIAIQPDLVLIYAGHNEYLGVMGVGSVYAGKGGHGANLLFLTLKDLRVFQLVQLAYYRLFASGDNTAITSTQGKSHTLMAKVAKEKNIPYASPLYQAGLTQFTDNLDRILSKYQQAEIPVLLGTLAANEVDQKPFASAPDLDFAAVDTLWKQGQLAAAKQQLQQQLSDHPDSADSHFKLAKTLMFEGDMPAAQAHFSAAMDRDLLRFRAPSEFNAIIRRQAKAHGAWLVDSQAFIRQNNQGWLDNRVMYEHLHPNQLGYFLLAEAYLQHIVERQLLGSAPQPVSTQQAWQDMPITATDVVYADFKIKSLKADYPFSTTPQKVEFGEAQSFAEKTALSWLNGRAWLQIQQDQLAYYQKQQQLPEAAKVAGILFDALPNNSKIAEVASLLYRDNQDPTMAYYYARKASELQPDNTEYLMNLAQMQFQLKRRDAAIRSLQAVLLIDPKHNNAQYYLRQLQAEQ
jgi:tetratricopeptide (TPR) repeat protein